MLPRFGVCFPLSSFFGLVASCFSVFVLFLFCFLSYSVLQFIFVYFLFFIFLFSSVFVCFVVVFLFPSSVL